jgi:UPF0042 nucleotide-binding protein
MTAPTTVHITSYGTGHTSRPALAVNPVIVDTTELRNPPDDPAVRAKLTRLTGFDDEVIAYVLNTPGARQLIGEAIVRIRQRLGAGGEVHVHVHCYGGRHRSVAVAEQLLTSLTELGVPVTIKHLHVHAPLLPSRGDR